MYINVYIHLYMYIHVHTHICTYMYSMYTHMYMYTHIYIHVFNVHTEYIHVYIHLYMYIHVHTHIRTYMYSMYTHMNMYTHRHSPLYSLYPWHDEHKDILISNTLTVPSLIRQMGLSEEAQSTSNVDNSSLLHLNWLNIPCMRGHFVQEDNDIWYPWRPIVDLHGYQI